MDEEKLEVALVQCMALAKERPRVPRIAEYLSQLQANPAWSPDELAELQRRVIAALMEADQGDDVL